MPEKETRMWEWALANRAPKNPSSTYEAVLIARIIFPQILQGLCFGLMLANRADNGGQIITCAQSFPEGETHTLAYVRIWEPISEEGVVIRPITKVVPRLQETHGVSRDRNRNREFFEGPIDMVDLAVATGTRRGGLVPTTGFSRIGGTIEQGHIGLFRDLQTNARTAINLVTGQLVRHVGESEPEHGFTQRALATPFEIVHQGIPYLHKDGTVSIARGSGTFNLPAIGNLPARQVEMTAAIAFDPSIE